MKYSRYIIALCTLALVAYALIHYYMGQHKQGPNVNTNLPMETISIGTNTLHVEVASTDAEREQGLSGRTSLAKGSGMLFVFEPSRVVGFWMKDMNFDLDMIFASDDGTIVKIDRDVLASSYPEVFPSDMAVRYVLEVPRGYAAQAGLAVGQKIVVQ